jgi:hypothetical protein
VVRVQTFLAKASEIVGTTYGYIDCLAQPDDFNEDCRAGMHMLARYLILDPSAAHAFALRRGEFLRRQAASQQATAKDGDA